MPAAVVRARAGAAVLRKPFPQMGFSSGTTDEARSVPRGAWRLGQGRPARRLEGTYRPAVQLSQDAVA